MAQHLYLLNAWRMKGKCSLDTDAVGGNTSDREAAIRTCSPSDAHDGAPHQLDPLSLPFDDAEMNLNIIADPQFGKIRQQADVILPLLLIY